MQAVVGSDTEQKPDLHLFGLLKDPLGEKASPLLGAPIGGSHVAIARYRRTVDAYSSVGTSPTLRRHALPEDRIRRPGSGRKRITEIYPDLVSVSL